MVVLSARCNSFLSRIKTLLPAQQCLYHKLVGVGSKSRSRKCEEMGFEPGEINVSKWKKMDSRSLGITQTMIPSSTYTLLKILQKKGHKAYLVGGCVRDLLLNRTPKDFDVITTADLSQVRKQFHRCVIVGRKFPICRVNIKGSIIEVSSFQTLAKHSEDKEKYFASQKPRGCDRSDFNLWKNSMHRDFTVNSLFFNPLIYMIYDYNNGMKDLLELKLRTILPAHLSLKEDSARILRGLRLAARLGLSFSKDIETTIFKRGSSVLDLSTSRIMMEIDYMFSYGAAESSLHLLHRFHILEKLLPVQAAYISRQTSRSGEDTMMLMALFSHMDKFVSCEHPSTCALWIGLLAFHQALINEPQDPFVVLSFASVLYHQEWQCGLEFARQCGQSPASFGPEILEPCDFMSDEDVSFKVHQLAKKVVDSIDVLVDKDCLCKKMLGFPGFQSSDLVFIPKKSAVGAAKLFHVLLDRGRDELQKKGRTSFEINHQLLGKGDVSESSFLLGKIILNTMGCQVNHGNDTKLAPCAENGHITSSNSRSPQPDSHNPKKQKQNAESSNSKEQNIATQKKMEVGRLLEQEQQKNDVSRHVELRGTSSCPKMEDCTMEKPEESTSESQTQKLNCKLETVTENVKCPLQLEVQNPKETLNGDAKVERDPPRIKEQSMIRKHKRIRLSSLFK